MTVCAGCQKPIMDRYLMNVLDRNWHAACVACAACNCPLTDKCFSRDGKLYCRNDFFRYANKHLAVMYTYNIMSARKFRSKQSVSPFISLSYQNDSEHFIRNRRKFSCDTFRQQYFCHYTIASLLVWIYTHSNTSLFAYIVVSCCCSCYTTFYCHTHV